MSFEAGSLGRSALAALAGAFATAALVFAVVAAKADAGLVTPEAATPQPVIVPQPTGSPAPAAGGPGAVAPAEPASDPGSAEPALPDDLVMPTSTHSSGPQDDSLNEWASPDLSGLDDLAGNLADAVSDFRNVLPVYLEATHNSAHGFRGETQELIRNVLALDETVHSLIQDLQNPPSPGSNPAAPEDRNDLFFGWILDSGPSNCKAKQPDGDPSLCPS